MMCITGDCGRDHLHERVKSEIMSEKSVWCVHLRLRPASALAYSDMPRGNKKKKESCYCNNSGLETRRDQTRRSGGNIYVVRSRIGYSVHYLHPCPAGEGTEC